MSTSNSIENLLLEFDYPEEELEACLSMLRGKYSENLSLDIIRVVFRLCSKAESSKLLPSEVISGFRQAYRWATFIIEAFPDVIKALDFDNKAGAMLGRLGFTGKNSGDKN